MKYINIFIAVALIFSTPKAYSQATSPIMGFRDLNLSSPKATIIEAIKNDRLLRLPPNYEPSDIKNEEGEEFFSLGQTPYIKSGYFLFKNNSLYSIRIEFNTEQFSYLDLARTLREKYGNGVFVNANVIKWQNGGREIIFERPNVVKYFDSSAVDSTYAAYTNTSSPNKATREEILSGL